MGRSLVVPTIALALVALAACGLSLDGFTDGPVVIVPEGGPNDGSSPIDAGADAVGTKLGEAGTALITNGGFEDDQTPPCGKPWVPFQATLTRSADAHTGASACLVCYTGGGGTGYTIDQDNNDPTRFVAAGINLHASAFVRAVTTSQAQQIEIALRIYPLDGGASQGHPGTNVALTTAWQQITVDWTTPIEGQSNVLVVASDQVSSNCFLVDDIDVEVVP